MLGVAFFAACGGSGSSPADHKVSDASTDDTDSGEHVVDGGTGDATDGGGDAAPDEEEGGPIFPDEPVVTQYWMRTDIDTTMGIGVETGTITLSAYSLVAVTRSKTGYEMVDLQCQVAASNGKCGEQSAFCETVDVEAHEGQAYAPSHRTLAFDGNRWTSSACAQAVGWKWSCTEDAPETAPPTSEDDPLVYNPGVDHPMDFLPGVDMTITFAGGSLDEPYWCLTAAAQKVDVIYSGDLVNGDLALTGVVTDNGSVQGLLNDYCGSFETPKAQGPGTLRLVNKTFQGGSDASQWTCPTLAEFQAAFNDG